MIYLPPPQPVLNKDIRISGDVEIHPTASIAPGVILQAAPNYRIVIGADVCIGMGVIINACIGSIDISSGAILGSGVLIVGACKIDSNACIGTAVTIFQTDVEAMQVIEPGAILGDRSRKLDLQSDAPHQDHAATNSSVPKSSTTQNKSNSTTNNSYSFKNSPNKTVAKDVKSQQDNNSTFVDATVKPTPKKSKEPVVGQVYINQLLVTLFPHNKELNSLGKQIE